MNSRTRVQATTQEVASSAQRRLVYFLPDCLPASDLQLHASSAICITALQLLRTLLPAQPVTPGQTLLSLHLFAPHQFG